MLNVILNYLLNNYLEEKIIPVHFRVFKKISPHAAFEVAEPLIKMEKNSFTKRKKSIAPISN